MGDEAGNQNKVFPPLNEAQLSRAIQSLGDFQQALSALTFLHEECDFSLRYSTAELRRFRCYESCAIISFARPFEVARGRTVLGLRAVGVQFTESESQLKGKIIELRRKVIAHSDDERMHFLIATVRDSEEVPVMPLLRFQETLYLEPEELANFEMLLRKLISGIAKAIFRIAQSEPGRIDIYKRPSD